jgi:ribosomal protein L19
MARVVYASPPSAAQPSPTRHPVAPPRAAPQQGTNTVNVLDEIVADQIRTDLPELASGDTVKVSARVVEGGKERIQVFEGTVMRLRGGGITRSITVRKIASGRS